MTPDFPEGFQGSGPMFAAVDLGDPWYNLAKLGEVTYVAENADVPGRAAFLDRADAESVADMQTGGEFTRWTGLSGWNEVTPGRAAADAAIWNEVQGSQAQQAALTDADAVAAYEAEWANEWDDPESATYHQAEHEAEAG